jgi:Tol biopolymer transport system component
MVALLVHSTELGAVPTNGKIAFTSNRDGNDEIYVMNADGTGQTNLTNHPGYDSVPEWSPDGTKIAFVSDRSGDTDIYIMNADGSGVTNLTNDANADVSPSWSPDGKVLFSSDRSGNHELYVMNADGSNVTLLAAHPATDYAPTSSPDGNRIAFWSSRDPGNGDWSIYTMNSDGSGVTADLYPNGVNDYDPIWSPDGTKIIFWSGTGNSHDVYEMNPDGSGVTNLTSDPADDAHPEPSPDGTQIVFTSNRSGTYQICLMASTGGAVNCLTTGAQGQNQFGTWQPVSPSTTSVNIDIKPGSFPNSVNVNSNGVIPVAILGTEEFDATTVNALTVLFGPNAALEIHGQGHIQDVNNDGRPDMVLHFRTANTGITCGDTSASLTGFTTGGESIQGSDSVKTVGCQ